MIWNDERWCVQMGDVCLEEGWYLGILTKVLVIVFDKILLGQNQEECVMFCPIILNVIFLYIKKQNS